MRTDLLVERLSRDLRPVRRRSVAREAVLLLLLGALEVAAFLGMGLMRPDMPAAMHAASFWWKLASMGLLAVLGGGVALLSADPERSPRTGLRWLLACLVIVFASGWLVDASTTGLTELGRRLDWQNGLQCVWKMVALSLPPAVALGSLVSRGAPTDRAGTALAAGLSSACWGAFVFVFALSVGRPALHRRLVHGWLLHRHASGTGSPDQVVTVVSPQSADDRRRSTRTVVITGASAGVGRACAEAFARAGWNVALIARGVDGLEGARAAAERFGVAALAVPADVADSDAVDAAASRIEAELGPIDVWVNAAMVTAYSPVGRMSAGEFRRITEVVYLGTVHGTMTALRLMRERGGVIVQVGSALAYRALPLQSAYSGSKFAVRGFTEALRAELRHERSAIRVVMVQLPAVNTPQFDWARNRMERLPQPAPPIYQPEAIAAVILRAASGKARELWVGASAVKVILSNALAPWIVETLLARLGYAAQQSLQPEPGDRPDNLVSPLPGDHGARGRFGAGARARAWVVNPDLMQLGAACVAVLGVLTAVAWQRTTLPDGRNQRSTSS